MNKIIGKVRRALDEYNMINDNDKVAIALSGGKDSVALLVALSEIKKYYSKNFDIVAITLDPCFNNKKTDFSNISKLCDKINIEHIIKQTNLWEIIFEIRKEKSKIIAAIFETIGQFFYVYAMSGNAVIATPIVGSYCILSLIWSRIFLN